jgi:enolase
MKEIINEIVKQAGASNEKSVKMDWDENKTRTTENGVKVRYTTNGKFVGLKTLCDVLIGNMKDIEGLLKMIDTDIENITWAKFNNLVEKVKQDQSRYGDGMVKQNFKTIRIAFEDILTEKGIDPIKENKIPHIKVDSWESGIDILE